ncbi:MAG: VIT domain-containing protein [Polyangiaceae bacterium]
MSAPEDRETPVGTPADADPADVQPTPGPRDVSAAAEATRAPTATSAPPPDEEDRLVVKRGPLEDSAEWNPEGPPSSPFRREPSPSHAPPTPPAPNPLPHLGSGQRPWALIAVVAVLAGLALVAIFLRPKPPVPFKRPLITTFADLAPVHAGVTAAGEDIRVLTRVGVGSEIATDENGSARLRLDTGTVILVDRSTAITVTDKGVDLKSGRVFVTSTEASTIGLGDATVIATASSTAFERRKTTKVYAASGDVTLRIGGADTTIHTGESGVIDGGKAKVAGERGFDDWTGGMAAPWAAEGPPRRALGEVWGRTSPQDPGSPLTIRSSNVDAVVDGEVAKTNVQTTFFNAGSKLVVGDFRMAIPKGAIVSRFAVQRGNNVAEGAVALAARGRYIGTDFAALGQRGDVLEWAGDGWLRGTIPNIAPGATATIIVSYVEWLSPRPKGSDSTVVQYRFPMVGDGAPPLIGEFFARIDAGPSKPIALAAGMNARVNDTAVEVRRPDFRPTADLVVDIEMPRFKQPARAYVARGLGDDDPTLVVRTEVPTTLGGANGKEGAPPPSGVTIALVLDRSTSVDGPLLDAGKGFVGALVEALGPNDRVLVLAADQGVSPVGPAAFGPVDAERKAAIRDALAKLERGGATDLGRSLELAQAKLPADAPDAMVIYVGDGWPTLGDPTPEAIRARLARRRSGAARVGAVVVGPSANRRFLAALTKDSGPLIEIADTADAARASVDLLESALVPTVTGVSIDLGPGVERVYPRSELAVPRGSTITYVGTLREDAPKNLVLTWRGPDGIRTETRTIEKKDAVYADDARRRWAALRVESIALSGGGREATTDAAMKAQLITPWTALATGRRGEYEGTALAARVLDTAIGLDLGFNAAFNTPSSPGSTLMAPADLATTESFGWDVESALSAAAARVLREAYTSMKACRDSHLAQRPELSGNAQIRFELDGAGSVKDVRVQGVGDDVPALDRCLADVVAKLDYPKSLTKDAVEVTYVVNFPPPDRTLGAHKCSPTSSLPLPLRRGVWQERVERLGPVEAYVEALRSCELPTWTAKRSLLELTRAARPDLTAVQWLGVADELELKAMDRDAAKLVRDETQRFARPDELKELRAAMLQHERIPGAEFDKQYGDAKDDAGRLAVVARFLGFAPHSTLLRTRELELLAALKDAPNLVQRVALLRDDPLADATVLALGAHLLRAASADLEGEARRTFFEITERGPYDPWGRAFLGDRLRAEGWFDEATDSYEALERLRPGDGASAIRLALAHVGAGRIDMALRILSRVEKSGGRSADRRASLLANRLAHLVVASAKAQNKLAEADLTALGRRANDFAALGPSPIVVVRTEGGLPALELGLSRGPEKAREVVVADAAIAGIGLYTIAIPEGDVTNAILSIAQPKGYAPSAPRHVEVLVLGGGAKPVLTTMELDLALTGTAKRLKWDGSALTAMKDEPAKAKP